MAAKIRRDDEVIVLTGKEVSTWLRNTRSRFRL